MCVNLIRTVIFNISLIFVDIVIYLIVSYCATYTRAQETELDSIREVSKSLNDFAIKLLHQASEIGGEKLNFLISAYTVWSLLCLIDEGARGNTSRELELVLNIPPNKEAFRRNYKSLKNFLLETDSEVDLNLWSAIFSPMTQSLNRNFESVAKTYYGIDVTPIDFSNATTAASIINSYVSTKTQNKIPLLVTDDDLLDAEILVITASSFKGQWKTPFNPKETGYRPFKDHLGNVKGQLTMMHHIAPYPYASIPEIRAEVVELPYGKDNRFSMIVILPNPNVTLSNVLRNVSSIGFSSVLQPLSIAERDYSDEDVEVIFPKFAASSDLNLNVVLRNMGVAALFDPSVADLLGIVRNYLSLSRIIQLAKIEVTEQGAPWSTTDERIRYLSRPPTFQADRDFAYFIVEKPTRSIIFAGRITNPSALN